MLGRAGLLSSLGLVLMLGGCGTGPADPPVPADEVTWHGEVAPIFAEHCAVCHRSGGVGGFSLDTYADAKPLAIWVSNTVRSGKMPPWTLADDSADCAIPGPFKHRLVLSDQQIQWIEDWADGGAPQGDPESAAPLPDPLDRELSGVSYVIERSEGWAASSVQDAEDFRCFLLDPGVTDTRYLTGIQVEPDALEVLHHVFAYRVPADRAEEFEGLIGEDGSYECFAALGFSGLDPLLFWLPDTLPTEFPNESSVALEPGSRILLQAHYHTWEEGASDATTVALRWQDEPTQRGARLAVFGNDVEPPVLQPNPKDPPEGPEFRIPEFEFGHVELLRIPIEAGSSPQRVFGFAPRMNYAGTTLRLSIAKADGSTVCLGDVPDWTIDTMRFYEYDLPFEELPVLEAGDSLDIRCGYDNTSSNDALRDVLAEHGFDAPQTIYFGPGPLDEQCMVVLGLTEG